MVRKSSGDLRICVNYRKLNDVTMVTSYPLPNITETLDKLTGASYFTSIDMVSGYHQVEVAEEDKEKTAFVSSYGLYQYCRMPYGWQEHRLLFNQLSRTWFKFSIPKILWPTLMTSYASRYL